MAFLSLGPPWSMTATEVQVLVESSEGDTQSPLQHRVRSQRSPLSAAGAAGVGAGSGGSGRSSRTQGGSVPLCSRAARSGGRSRRLYLEPVRSAPRQLPPPLPSGVLPEPASAGSVLHLGTLAVTPTLCL